MDESNSKDIIIPSIHIPSTMLSSDAYTVSSFEKKHPPDMTSYQELKKRFQEQNQSSTCCVLI